VKSNQISELRTKSDAELLLLIDEMKQELFTVRCVGKTGNEKAASKGSVNSRRRIAQALTILRERELSQSLREPLL
jgi:ribosomal protein L29